MLLPSTPGRTSGDTSARRSVSPPAIVETTPNGHACRLCGSAHSVSHRDLIWHGFAGAALQSWREVRRASAGLQRAGVLLRRHDQRRAFACWLHQHARAFRSSATKLQIHTVLRSMRHVALRRAHNSWEDFCSARATAMRRARRALVAWCGSLARKAWNTWLLTLAQRTNRKILGTRILLWRCRAALATWIGESTERGRMALILHSFGADMLLTRRAFNSLSGACGHLPLRAVTYRHISLLALRCMQAPSFAYGHVPSHTVTRSPGPLARMCRRGRAVKMAGVLAATHAACQSDPHALTPSHPHALTPSYPHALTQSGDGCARSPFARWPAG